MEFEVLGDATSGPTVDLDHEEFAYAGKFVMSNTGKLIATDAGTLVGAVSFSPDRVDTDQAWLRYLTVRQSRRGEGIGAKLAAVATRELHQRGFGEVRIGVNNAFAFQALYRAGFGWTGEETGIAELVLTHPDPRPVERYQAGYEVFAARSDLSTAERQFINDHRNATPPTVVDPAD